MTSDMMSSPRYGVAVLG